MLPVLLWRVVLPGLRQRPLAKYHPDCEVVAYRCNGAARTVHAVSAAVAEVDVKMPQWDAMNVASAGNLGLRPVAVVDV